MTVGDPRLKECRSEWMEFLQWLDRHGMRCSSLALETFSDTGRGLAAVREFVPGDALVSVPSTILITAARARRIAPAASGLSQHAAIALWVAVTAVRCADETAMHPWQSYFKVLPKSFPTLPYFMPKELVDLLPSDILETVSKQRTRIDADYAASVTAMASTSIHVSKNTYEWAWFVVNTRCISLDTNPNPDQQCRSRTRIVLAPFLDCLNHSPNASIRAGLEPPQSIESTSGADEPPIPAGGAYVIRTLDNIKIGHQAFINYGPHDNHFLLCEYGFVVPSNPYNHVSLDAEFIQMVSKLPRSVTTILESHGMLGYYPVSRDDGVGYRLINAMRLVSAYISPRVDDNPKRNAHVGYGSAAQGVRDSVLTAWLHVLRGESECISIETERDAYTLILRLLNHKRKKTVLSRNQIDSGMQDAWDRDVVGMCQAVLDNDIAILDSCILETQRILDRLN